MYHPAKVIEILSNKDKNIRASDDTTQAVLEMWDENQFTFLVDPIISKKIKKNDIVLVDYRPISEKTPVPNHKVVKIISGKLGQEVWKSYQRYHDKNKQNIQANYPGNMSQNYMG